mgnify:CR=1 FL=1
MPVCGWRSMRGWCATTRAHANSCAGRGGKRHSRIHGAEQDGRIVAAEGGVRAVQHVGDNVIGHHQTADINGGQVTTAQQNALAFCLRLLDMLQAANAVAVAHLIFTAPQCHRRFANTQPAGDNRTAHHVCLCVGIQLGKTAGDIDLRIAFTRRCQH